MPLIFVLIHIKVRRRANRHSVLAMKQWSVAMTGPEMAFLSMVVIGMTAFAITLAWATNATSRRR